MSKAAHDDSRLARVADVNFSPIVMRPSDARPIGAERRNLNARAALNARVRREFQEMPGTCLTLPQAARLFGIEHEICLRIFAEMISTREIRVTDDRRYRLHSVA